MKCKICSEPLIGREKICEECANLISRALPPIERFVDKSFLIFVLSNRGWLQKMLRLCDANWHGGVTISAKRGQLTHTRFFETDLIEN